MIRVTPLQLLQLNEKGFSRIGFSIWDVFDEGVNKFDNTYYCIEISVNKRTCFRIPVTVDKKRGWGKDILEIKCDDSYFLFESMSQEGQTEKDTLRVFLYKKSIADEFKRLFNKKADYNTVGRVSILSKICFDCLSEILKTYKRKY